MENRIIQLQKFLKFNELEEILKNRTIELGQFNKLVYHDGEVFSRIDLLLKYMCHDITEDGEIHIDRNGIIRLKTKVV